MSAPISLLLDVDTVHAIARGGHSSRAFAWSSDAPDAMVDAVRAAYGAPSGITLVIGLGLLEITEPELPPLSVAARRAVIWRDADRYFPIDEPVAVACADAMAFGVSARRLESWVRAVTALGSVRAIVTAPQVAAKLVGTGARSLAAAEGERGLMRAINGRLQSVRRAMGADPARDDGTLLTATELGRAALEWAGASLADQLLDPTIERRMRASRSRRTFSIVAVAAIAVIALSWSTDRWRDSQVADVETLALALAQRAEPARLSETRGAQARTELVLLREAESRRVAPDAPLVVLAQLSRILPRDAFVQRLEWDGQSWRVEGTADNAPRLVPLIDADAHFRDVRIAASSQRFVDAGRQRESFAISFQTKRTEPSPVGPDKRGTNGTP